MLYSQLDAPKIIATLERLERRIVERFPESRLRRVAQEICTTARRLPDTAFSLGRPHWAQRTAAAPLIVILVLASFAALGALLTRVAREQAGTFGNITDIAQGIEATVNAAIFLALATYFLLSWERRAKRKVALRALHQLQRVDDNVVLEAASDIENLTIGLSRKIWQKLIVLQGSSA